MWYSDVLMTDPNLAASLYVNLNGGSSSHELIAKGWLDSSEVGFTIEHEWANTSDPISSIIDQVAGMLTSGGQLGDQLASVIGRNALGSKIMESIKDTKVGKTLDSSTDQWAWVGPSKFLKQYSGSNISIPDLKFTTVFLNDDYDNKTDVKVRSEFSKLIDRLLPGQFELVQGLLAKMTAPNGYKLPITKAAMSSELKGSFLICQKGVIESKDSTLAGEGKLNGAFGNAGIKFPGKLTGQNRLGANLKSTIKLNLIPNLLLTSAIVNRSSNLVWTSNGKVPAYYTVTMEFTYGKPLRNSDFKDML